MHFSYSTIRDCLQPDNSHNWLNKLWKIKRPVTENMKAGGKYQRIIQRHVSNEERDSRIEYIEEFFPIVERKNFDPDCKFEIDVKGYKVIGYFDGKNPQEKKSLEIKLSGGLEGRAPTPWTLGKFKKSIQRKIYVLAEPTYTKSVIITGSLDPDHWDKPFTKLKVREVDNTQKDMDEALEWLTKGIEVFENGDYNGGLDENGRCTLGRMCPWGDACHFKRI